MSVCVFVSVSLCCAVEGKINTPRSVLYFLIYLRQLLHWLHTCTLLERHIKKKTVGPSLKRRVHASVVLGRSEST